MAGRKGDRKKIAPPVAPTSAPLETESPRERALWWGATVIATIAIHAATLGGDWLVDDDVLVTPARLMGDLDGLGRIWRGDGTLDFIPLTLTSFWIEARFFDGPSGHRVVNLALHALDACLVGAVLARARAPYARAVGLLFAVHPLTVSSVAWISERKNVLSLCFGLLALLVALPRSERWPTPRALALACALFALALLCKAQLVGLPLVLFGLFALRGGPMPRHVRAGLGVMLAVALVMGWLTMLYQAPASSVHGGTLVERVVRASDAVRFYLARTAWPSPLAMFQSPHAARASGLGAWASLVAIVASIAGLAWAHRAKKPWALPVAVAVLAYLVLLAPALGFVDMSFMRFSFVSEHFGYFALPIPIAGAVWGLARVPRRMALGAIAVATLALGLVAHDYALAYTSREALWAENAEAVPDAAVAHGNLALLLQARGRQADALAHAREAVRLSPSDGELHLFLGTVLMQEGALDEARAELEAALALDPSLSRAHNNLATILVSEGQVEGGIAHLRAALAITPDYAVGHLNLARLLALSGDTDAAERERAEAVALDPSLASMPLRP